MSPVLPLTDFPDHLSPMVVKELRQGLRMRMFGGVFLTLHIILILLTLMSGAASNDSGITSLFDTLVSFTLCLIFPLRGYSALSLEMKSGTLDMLVLTRLSAWRIVLGKWASTALLSLLVALSLLPYVVSRYVFGGIDLAGEMKALFLKWLIGIGIAAIVVCISTIRQQWLRALIVGLPLVGLAFFSFIFGILSSFGGSSGTSITSSLGPLFDLSIWLHIPLFAWAIFAVLGIATARIDPPSSLFPVFKRSVHLLALLLVIGVGYLSGAGATIILVGSIMLNLIVTDTILEHNGDVPSVYAFFYRRGGLGRLVSWFFTPGWASGYIFSLILTIITALIAYAINGLEAAATIWLTACSLWMIACIMQVISRDPRGDRLTLFIMISICLHTITALLTTLMLALPVGSTSWVGVVLPSLVMQAASHVSTVDRDQLLLVGVAISSIWPVLHLFQSMLAHYRARDSRAEALQIIHHQS